jgi:hypothetical protein
MKGRTDGNGRLNPDESHGRGKAQQPIVADENQTEFGM